MLVDLLSIFSLLTTFSPTYCQYFRALYETSAALLFIFIGSANTTLILFRMGQEILNNTLKHSCAKHVTISLHVSEKLFTLSISDDGVGFNLEEKILSGGSGLLNLQNRAKLIHAEFSIQSSPNGTAIIIQLPLVDNVITAHPH